MIATAFVPAPSAPIEKENTPGHTAFCLARLAALDNYLDRWAGQVCPWCLGWGWTAGGECPNCFLLGICPRCSQALNKKNRCPGCQWEDGAAGFTVIGSRQAPDLLCNEDCTGQGLILVAMYTGRRWVFPQRR